MAETNRRLLTPVKPSSRRRTSAELAPAPDAVGAITALLGDVALDTDGLAPAPPPTTAVASPEPPRRPLYRVIDASTPPLAADGGLLPRLAPGPGLARCRACLRRHLEAHGDLRQRAATPFTSFTLDLLRALSIAARAADAASVRVLVVDPARLAPGSAATAWALTRELTGRGKLYLLGEYLVLGPVPAAAVVGVWRWPALLASPLLRAYLPANLDGLLGRGVQEWRDAVRDQLPRPVARLLDPDGVLLEAAIRSQWGRGGGPGPGATPAVTGCIVATITGWRERRPYAPLPGKAQFYDTVALPGLAQAARGHILDDISQGRAPSDGGRDDPGAQACRCVEEEAATTVLARASAELRTQLAALEPAIRDMLQTATILRSAVASRAPETAEVEETLAELWLVAVRHRSALTGLAGLLWRNEGGETVSQATRRKKGPRPVVRLPPPVSEPGCKSQGIVSIAVTEVS